MPLMGHRPFHLSQSKFLDEEGLLGVKGPIVVRLKRAGPSGP